MKRPRHYILIDDDSTSNLIGEFVIMGCDPEAEIRSYLDPEVAFLEIKENYKGLAGRFETLLFLDLNMPKMTGWEFLRAFRELDKDVKSGFSIHILTSSIEDFSAEKKEFPFVSGFISKPLKKEKLQEIFLESGFDQGKSCGT